MPPLRHDILIETSAVVFDRVYDAIAELRGAYGIMCALGEVTGTLPRSVHAQLPSLPYGPVEFDVDADDASAATTAWRAPLDALARDPDAVVTVPRAGEATAQARADAKAARGPLKAHFRRMCWFHGEAMHVNVR